MDISMIMYFIISLILLVFTSWTIYVCNKLPAEVVKANKSIDQLKTFAILILVVSILAVLFTGYHLFYKQGVHAEIAGKYF